MNKKMLSKTSNRLKTNGVSWPELAMISIISLSVHCMFFWGPLSFRESVTNISDAKLRCVDDYGVIIFELKDQREFVTSKKFEPCQETLELIKGTSLIVAHSNGGVIGELKYNGKVLFKSSPLGYSLFFSFILSYFAIAITRKIRSCKVQRVGI